mmetsp:Transcript_43447/g.139639  ORF Transcript_43447/g.139639 Transcript_43447/m.139639 type:complete len:212 (+) Transcript_43447:775-1410(+)
MDQLRLRATFAHPMADGSFMDHAGIVNEDLLEAREQCLLLLLEPRQREAAQGPRKPLRVVRLPLPGQQAIFEMSCSADPERLPISSAIQVPAQSQELDEAFEHSLQVPSDLRVSSANLLPALVQHRGILVEGRRLVSREDPLDKIMDDLEHLVAPRQDLVQSPVLREVSARAPEKGAELVLPGRGGGDGRCSRRLRVCEGATAAISGALLG